MMRTHTNSVKRSKTSRMLKLYKISTQMNFAKSSVLPVCVSHVSVCVTFGCESECVCVRGWMSERDILWH